MTMKLTNRDRILLYVMAGVLIVFAFVWLLILPQMNRSSELDLSISELETQKLPMEAAVMGLDRMAANVETAKEDLKLALADFYPKMENYEIDKTLTGLMIDQYGLYVENLSMSPVATGVIVPLYSGAPLPEASQGEPDAAAPAAATDPAAIESFPLLTSQVSITASGTRAALQNFVDDLFLDYPSIRVTDYAIAEADVTTLSLTCDFYMQAE